MTIRSPFSSFKAGNLLNERSAGFKPNVTRPVGSTHAHEPALLGGLAFRFGASIPPVACHPHSHRLYRLPRALARFALALPVYAAPYPYLLAAPCALVRDKTPCRRNKHGMSGLPRGLSNR